jgi:hypothetical protein
MKNWKQSVFFGMVAIIVLVFGFVACDDKTGETEQPQDWSETTINLFGGRTATIEGKGLTKTEWDNARSEIAGKINSAYNVIDHSQEIKIAVEELFDAGVTIIVEKTPSGYTNYKTSGRTLYVYVDGIGNLNVDTAVSTMAVCIRIMHLRCSW